MAAMLDGVVLGERYAYLDGVIHRADSSVGARFSGQYGVHSLARLPQCESGATSESLSQALGRHYWQAAAQESQNARVDRVGGAPQNTKGKT
jgi:hypothetical protein